MVDSSDEDKPVRRRRVKRKQGFLDEEADDTAGECSESTESEDGDLSDFIDDAPILGAVVDLQERRALEIQNNKIALTNHIATLSKTEREAIGLTFAYTNYENIFE